MDVDVSSQGGIYGPKGLIPSNFSAIEALMEVGVSSQGEVTSLRGESLDILYN